MAGGENSDATSEFSLEPLMGDVAPRAILCTVTEGATLFIPALWSHAVASSVPTTRGGRAVSPMVPRSQAHSRTEWSVTSGASYRAKHDADGINAAVSIFYVRGTRSFERAIAAAPSFRPSHLCYADALRLLGRQHGSEHGIQSA